MNWLNLFKPMPKNVFSAWQIELTTRCPLRCRMCIREGIKEWHNGDMSFENFKTLIPYFKYVETVVLEGWGESLLYKNLIDVIRLVKTEGPQVGFVTGGKGLDRKYIFELINAGVDFIGFSLAGSSARTHESIRVNSDFGGILENTKTFNEIKASKKLGKPKLHIVYLMLRDNISEVPYLMNLAKDIGIAEVVLTNLTHVANEWQESQRVFICNGRGAYENKSGGTPDLPHNSAIKLPVGQASRLSEKVFYEKILNETELKARELKIKIRRPSLSPVEVPVCEENPLRNLYISVDGEVSPCVYLNPPVPSPFKRIYCGNKFETEKVSFGNIFREPFHAIWNKKEYIDFRESFILRKRRFEEIYSPFLDMERLKRFEVIPLPDPPKQCRTCHKMLGV